MSLIQSCLRVLDDRRDIDHVLVLTGDIDYRGFVIQLKNRKLRVTLICQEGNHNPYLVDDAHRAYSVSFVAEFPHTWWNQAPQAEIAAILDARYTYDSGKIAELVKQLDPAKPFHSAGILAVLESRFDLTADDSAAFEKLKTLVSPALKHFENQVYETRDRQAIARVDRVWEKIRGLDLYHLQLLGTDKLPDAFEKLLPLLEHPDKDYKQTAIRSLGNLGGLAFLSKI